MWNEKLEECRRLAIQSGGFFVELISKKRFYESGMITAAPQSGGRYPIGALTFDCGEGEELQYVFLPKSLTGVVNKDGKSFLSWAPSVAIHLPLHIKIGLAAMRPDCPLATLVAFILKHSGVQLGRHPAGGSCYDGQKLRVVNGDYQFFTTYSLDSIYLNCANAIEIAVLSPGAQPAANGHTVTGDVDKPTIEGQGGSGGAVIHQAAKPGRPPDPRVTLLFDFYTAHKMNSPNDGQKEIAAAFNRKHPDAPTTANELKNAVTSRNRKNSSSGNSGD